MRHIWLLILSTVLVFGCAKNRDVERVRDGDRQGDMAKASFLGAEKGRTMWLTKMTVVNTSDSPSGSGVFIGFQGDVKIGYFDFNNTQLQFRSLNGLQEGKETENIKNSVLLSWPIEHVDYILNEKDGLTTNQEIKDNFKSWDQTKFFTLGAAPNLANENQMLPSSSFGTFSCWEPAAGRYTKPKMSIEADHIGYDFEVTYQRHPACGNAAQWNEGDFNFTVTYRYSFKKVESSDYEPKVFSNEQDPARYKYGHFQTVRKILNPKDGRPHNIFMENRWAEKTQHFYFVKGFPEKYKWIWDHTKNHTVLGQTNALLESAGSKLRFEIHDYNYNHETKNNDGPSRQFGDLRYSFINFIEELEAGGTPLGYGPSDTNPFTGEIIAANTMVWTGSLDFYLELMDSVGTGAQEESSLMRQLKAALNVGELDSLNTHWDQTKGVGKIFKHMAQQTRYGYPYWNGYTSDEAGQVLIPTVMEKYGQSSTSPSLGGDDLVSSVSSIISTPLSRIPFDFETRILGGRPQVRVKNPFDVINLDWLKRMAGTSDPELQGIVQNNGLADILKVINNIQGVVDHTRSGPSSPSSIARDYYEHASKDIKANQEGHCIMDFNEFAGGLAGFLKASKLNLKDPKVRADILNTVLYRVSIHEFGHNLNLRHNFYGSVDKENFQLHKKEHSWSNNLKTLNTEGEISNEKSRVQVSSSVMDYIRLEDEIDTPWAWEDYDMAAILDSYQPTTFDDKGHLYLFCTDEHTLMSALCNRHDLGTTPTQILMSQIRSYDERYELRNKRFGRAYWNSAGYARGVFSTMLSMKEFLPMWRSAFAEDIMFEQMEVMGITNKHEQSAYLEKMNREMRQVMKMTMGFYQAVLQQSRGDRDYRSEYDPTTGALKQIGIIADKIYAMLFLAGDDALYYNPNRVMIHSSFLTHSKEPGLAEFTDQLWRNIVTSRNVAMEPWFINFARSLYAKNATNFYNRDSANLIDDMRVIFVANAQDLKEQYALEIDTAQPIVRTTLTKAEGGAYKVGDEVIVVHSNGRYYMTSEAEQIAYSLFQGGLDQLTGAGGDIALQEFTMDVREFYWLYDVAKRGLLQ